MQCVYQADNVVEAELLKGLLAAHDVACHSGGFYLQGGVGELASQGFAKLWVDDADVEQAFAVIKAYEAGEFAVTDAD